MIRSLRSTALSLAIASLLAGCLHDWNAVSPRDGAVRDVTDAHATDGSRPDGASVDGCAGTICDSVCADLLTDPRHCGDCRTDCTALANVRSDITCTNGRCDTDRFCTAGWGDCLTAVPGCETNLSSVASCGACGRVCSGPTPYCGNDGGSYACTSACSPGQTLCGASCVDVQSDPNHCGGCGTVCGNAHTTSTSCMAGTCRLACQTGFADCDGVASTGCEADVNTIAQCGSCTTQCTTRANSIPRCAGGTCANDCSTGFADCDGNPMTGCEVNLRTDPNNCNACGVPCIPPPNSTGICTAGMCGSVCRTNFVAATSGRCMGFGGAYVTSNGGACEVGAENPFTGTCTCPGAFIDFPVPIRANTGILHVCQPAGLAPGSEWGGMFQRDATGTCVRPNSYTGGCTCPTSHAAEVIQNTGAPSGSADIHVCRAMPGAGVVPSYRGAFYQVDSVCAANPVTGLCGCEASNLALTFQTSNPATMTTRTTVTICME